MNCPNWVKNCQDRDFQELSIFPDILQLAVYTGHWVYGTQAGAGPGLSAVAVQISVLQCNFSMHFLTADSDIHLSRGKVCQKEAFCNLCKKSVFFFLASSRLPFEQSMQCTTGTITPVATITACASRHCFGTG